MITKIHLPITPPKATAQQQKTAVIGGKPRRYDPKNVAAAKHTLLTLLLQHRPSSPIEGPVRLSVAWVYPFLKKHLNSKGELKEGIFDGEPCVTRPDCDNLSKALCDQMTSAGYWRDDSQVALGSIAKCYGATPGIYIRIEPIIVVEYEKLLV